MFKIEKKLRRIPINGKRPEIIVISHSNQRPLSANEIKRLAYYYQNQYELKHKKKHDRMIIRGVNTLGYTTIKSADQPIDHMWDDEEDYFSNRVNSDRRFMECFQIEILMY